MKFTATRNFRLVFFLILIIYGTYYICDLVAGDHYDKIDTSETYTAYCLSKRPEIIDKQRITDLNCSLEKGQKRVYVSLSDEGINELQKKLPFHMIKLKCSPISVNQFVAIANNQFSTEDAENLIMNYAKQNNYDRLCNTDKRFKADELSLEYVDKTNQLALIIHFDL